MALNPDLFTALYKPDVLMCLADLSNDEVFTPPDVANQVLDMLPQELFRDPNTKFLDPALKSGVFLREIAKRLIAGLADKIPNLQERCDWIFKNQLYGIAITELTSLLGRRSVYCSKYPNSPFSITKFDDVQGNITFHKIRHRWDHAGANGKCVFCGTSYDGDLGDLNREGMETHAYEFIHTLHPEEIFNMKFDVICANPPYQLADGGSKASAKPIYQLFVQQAKKLNPRYMTMIIPARWYSGGKGLDAFRNDMLTDKHIVKMVDYFDSTECFPGVDISGGVCYFLWDRSKNDDCEIESHRAGKINSMKRPLLETGSDVFIRFNEAVSIVRKVRAHGESSFANMISARKPFGLDTSTEISSTKKSADYIDIYAYPKNGYINKNKIKQHFEWVGKGKVCVSYAYGERGEFPYYVIGKPFYAPENSCCTETYLVVSTVDTKRQAGNIISYMATKFFRFLVLLKKNTQHATKNVYAYVPIQDFDKPWSDEELYKKYNLSTEEISFIESMIRPMDISGGDE